jgi:hypothetical protein
VDSLRICLVGNKWGKGVDSNENHTVQEGALGGSGLIPLVKLQRVRYKLD